VKNAVAAEQLVAAERALELALSAGQNRPDRLPGLKMIFTQLPRTMADDIGDVSSLPLKVRLLEVAVSTLGEASALQPNMLGAAVRAERWRAWLYFIASPLAATLFVEAATGCEAFPPGLTPRKLTKTDANVVRILFRRMARSLSGAFSLLVDIPFDVGAVVDKIELEPQLSPTAPVIVARLSLDYPGHSGEVSIVIPHAALEPVRDLLAAAAPGDSTGASGVSSRYRDDSGWSKQLSEEISRAFINLNGVLEERPISLGEVQRFAVGSVVDLASTSLSRVRLDADEVPFFWCELGKRDGGLILRVEDDFDQDTEAIDEFYGL
jgi:flagellar motor switch protein FliM